MFKKLKRLQKSSLFAELWRAWKFVVFWHTAIFVLIFIVTWNTEPTEIGPVWMIPLVVDFPSTFFVRLTWHSIKAWFPNQYFMQGILLQLAVLIIGALHWATLATIYVFLRRFWKNQFPMEPIFDSEQDNGGNPA